MKMTDFTECDSSYAKEFGPEPGHYVDAIPWRQGLSYFRACWQLRQKEIDALRDEVAMERNTNSDWCIAHARVESALMSTQANLADVTAEASKYEARQRELQSACNDHISYGQDQRAKWCSERCQSYGGPDGPRRLEELQADLTAYRWMKEHDTFTKRMARYVWLLEQDYKFKDVGHSGIELDIDTAMSEQPARTEP